MRRATWLDGLLLAAACSGGAAASAADYTYARIVVPGSVATYPAGLNARGIVVGYWQARDRRMHGFVRRGNAIQNLDYPGSVATYPAAINNRGEIVGTYRDHGPQLHGFIYIKGVFQTVDFGSGTSLKSINDAGVVVGINRISTDPEVFTYYNGSYSPVTNLSYPSVAGINASGEIVGNYRPTAGNGDYGEVFTYQNGTLMKLVNPNPGTYGAISATGINAAGVVVGYIQTVPFSQFSFVWKNGVFLAYGGCDLGLGSDYLAAINDAGIAVGGHITYVNGASEVSVGTIESATACLGTLNVPGATSTTTIGINNAGQVLGSYKSLYAPTETFLATPAP